MGLLSMSTRNGDTCSARKVYGLSASPYIVVMNYGSAALVVTLGHVGVVGRLVIFTERGNHLGLLGILASLGEIAARSGTKHHTSYRMSGFGNLPTWPKVYERRGGQNTRECSRENALHLLAANIKMAR